MAFCYSDRQSVLMKALLIHKPVLSIFDARQLLNGGEDRKRGEERQGRQPPFPFPLIRAFSEVLLSMKVNQLNSNLMLLSLWLSDYELQIHTHGCVGHLLSSFILPLVVCHTWEHLDH